MKISLKNRTAAYTYGSSSGYYPFRGEKSIWHESLLERDLLILLEFNDMVLDVEEQPVTIEYENKNGKTVTYTPDFLVTFKSLPQYDSQSIYPKSLLIEVKPHEILKKKFHELRPKFKIATRYAQENDYIFKIYDDNKIRGIELENILLLKRYKKMSFDQREESRILEYLQAVGHTQIDHLIEALYATKTLQAIAISQLYHLIVHKKIAIDIGQEINAWSTIWLNIDETYEEGILNEL
ncbi:MAG: TnsA endonuclease N-terminal domain-containing protein [Sulfurimonas sp.]|uniref:TnsA endonuclease N-terminal domain-containing protein n=1 Tax=Sulfurimonas sp. TaxID=2022749 RepID=UPI00262739E3|nr:TnsA endonuclease N-terminal domain-containing protein [Sulfurimonas sp.]MDD2653244.1 TnsA endonuclease N-terminal domain-containing protein [Sulfurimonas sp.]MDD3452293.1 TnsA endonuclease N-terminal domain-containing protein [Sulfurimonas sp.]